MGITIIKAGIADTICDSGRFGYQHLGIPPGGAMDPIAFCVANALVGNDSNEGVIEMHYPASTIQFNTHSLIALTGANFGATIDGRTVPLNQPLLIPANSILAFNKNISGARVYLSIAGGFVAEKWLGSYSTQLLVIKGGFHGRTLKKNDCIAFKNNLKQAIESLVCLPWSASIAEFYLGNKVRFIAGKAYDLLDAPSNINLHQTLFSISNQSNRMGYRLKGPSLNLIHSSDYLSTAVVFGTMQLLPSGQIIILMADHQTTGGYPTIGHISSAYFASLAQAAIGDSLEFELSTIHAAENICLLQQENLEQLQNACNFRLQEYLANE